MDEFRRTIIRRHNLIKIVEENIGELSYNNEPINYCWDTECKNYRVEWHETMKSGMLDNIKNIERALKLIKETIELSNK